MKRIGSLIAFLLALGVSLHGESISSRFLLQYDLDGDLQLSRSELESYFRDQKNSDPADAATDVLTAFPGQRETISIDVAAMVITPTSPEKPQKAEGRRPCGYLKLERTVKDAPDPRGPESKFPTIFSYSRNEHAKDTDQLNVLGAVGVVDCAWHPGGGDLLNTTVGAGAGLDFEVDGSAEPSANSIAVSTPLFWRWVSSRSSRFLTGANVTVTPGFTTDRAFDREVWELAVKGGLRSPSLLRMGLVSSVFDAKRDPVFSIWWQPTMQFEFGDVKDAAGNADLEKLAGRYSRMAPRLDVVVWPRYISDRMTMKASLTERFNVDGASRSFVEATALYDITPAKNVTFTAVYRHGRKAPDFSAKDQWLIGIGIQR